jgi:hypothetical protein
MDRSIVCGDPIGLKAVQSIMQKAVQSNLSFFHKAGIMSSNIASLSPSVQQLLDVSRSPTCKMTLHTNAHVESKQLLYLPVIHLISSFVVSRPSTIESWYELGMSMKLYDYYIDQYRYQLDINLNVKEMIKRNIFISEIISYIGEMEDIDIAYSPNIVGIIRVYHNEHSVMSSIVKSLERSFFGIKEIKNVVHDDSTIITEGSNIDDILKHPNIDINRSFTNHILQMEQRFGLEAARDVLYEELMKHTEHKYAALIADVMTRTGKVKPFTKEYAKSKGPLISIGYEESSIDLRQMHTNKVKDDLQNSYSRMTVGLPPRIGTGYSDIISIDSSCTPDIHSIINKMNQI